MSKFKVGDKVIAKEEGVSGDYKVDFEGTVVAVGTGSYKGTMRIEELRSNFWYSCENFELVKTERAELAEALAVMAKYDIRRTKGSNGQYWFYRGAAIGREVRSEQALLDEIFPVESPELLALREKVEQATERMQEAATTKQNAYESLQEANAGLDKRCKEYYNLTADLHRMETAL